jgi:(6-4)DNA photolyase
MGDGGSRRWLFGDQLGPHFLDGPDQPALLVESKAVFRRRRFHRRKAHLMLVAIRARAADLGERADLVRAETYREALPSGERVSVCAPTSRAARDFVGRLGVRVLPARGWAVAEEQFAGWVERRGGRRLLLEDFYREVRRRHGILVEGDGEPVGGRWNFDADNREPAPKGAGVLADAVELAEPWWPAEGELDERVRHELDRWEKDGVEFLGGDGPRRFAATRAEALAALEHFVTRRLPAFGPYEDAMLAGDRWMAHSLLSVPLNLGLLHPVEVARRAARAYAEGAAPLRSVEGFVRQVIGWREYVWHLYWHGGERYRDRNELDARTPLPRWFAELDPDREVTANCLSHALAAVREEGWTHHIPRLMVLGNWALQHGYDPRELTDWFHRAFVDGYDWVMVPNVVGMSQHADGGVMATKPYAAGGAYINRMSDLCGSCAYDPRKRTGERACPYTAGYWRFLYAHRDRLAGNHRMRRTLHGLDRLADLDAVLAEAPPPDAVP